ncbi:MAG: DoxX family membrane protein [Thermoanaerobaculia bacterium]
MKALFFVGRLLFGGFFAFNGIGHFLQLGSLTGYAKMKGVPAPEAAVILTGVLLLLGGLSILTGAFPRAGVALIVLFLLPTSFIMHDFWTVADPMQRTAEMVGFLKNIALAGAALMFLAIPEPWPVSFSRRSGATAAPR